MHDLEVEIENYRKIDCSKISYFHEIDSFNCISDSKLKFFYLNIRSYNKNFDLLLVHLSLIKTKFDIIILGETWLGNSGGGMHLEGFTFFSTSKGANRCDGVIVYVSESVNASVREVELGGVFGLSLDFAYQTKQFNILAIYRTHDTDLDHFSSALEQYYSVMARHKTYALIGDVNANLLIPDNKTERYLDLLYDLGFMCGIDKPTRVTSDSQTCIDHIFIRHNTFNNIKTAIVETSITDHYSIIMEICLGMGKNKTVDGSKHRSTIDKEALSKRISECDWNSVLETENVNTSSALFMDKIRDCVQRSEKLVNPIQRYVPIKPWISTGIVRSIRRRDKLSKRVKTEPFNLELKNYFIAYRNRLNIIIRQSKINFYRNKINESKNNPKQFWQIINELAGKQTKKGEFPMEAHTADRRQNLNNNLSKQVADDFNNFFAEVGSDLARQIDTGGDLVVNDQHFKSEAEFTLKTIDELELLNYINSLRGGSAPGYDSISADFLKQNFKTLGRPLLHIINGSIKSGEFPAPFKIAKVIPIFKSKDITDKTNFRPISLLSVFTKVLEKIVKDQLTDFLNLNNLLAECQYGFRTSKNITDALFNLNTDINNAISKNKRSMLLFLDLAKAFDTVDRSILLKKLELIGVRQTALKWFGSYLSNRKQFVTINGTNSDQRNIDYGVIQGSTLGPVLFLIYINNMPKINITGKLYLFADDSAIFFEDTDWNKLTDKITNDLTVIKKWFDQNCLTLNVSKTKCLPISLRNAGGYMKEMKLHACDNINNQTCSCHVIEYVSSYKYLGVIFDSKLTWKEHITSTNNRLRKLVYAFKQLSEILTLKEIRTSYFAYAQSIIEGGIIAWGGTFKTNLQSLLVTQKAILKAALRKDRRYPSDEIFNEMQVLDVRQLFVKTLLNNMHKNFNTIFSNLQHEYGTRSARNFGISIPRIHRTFSTTCSFIISHYVYQKIPSQLRQFDSYSNTSYKLKIKKWLKELGRDNIEQLITPIYGR